MVVSDSQKADENNYEVPYDLLRPQRTNSYWSAVSHNVTQNTSIPAEPSWLKRSVKKLKSVFKRRKRHPRLLIIVATDVNIGQKG